MLADAAAPDIYDEALVDAVKLAQAEAELTPDGIVGPRTLAILNGRSREDDIAAVIANLERWRWMPRKLGAFHIMVNVPEFMVRVVNQGSGRARDAASSSASRQTRRRRSRMSWTM